MSIQCAMIIGFLVPHQCENRAVASCSRCNRQFCDEHLQVTPTGLVCLACQQGLDKPVLVAQTASSFDEHDLKSFIPDSDWESSDDDSGDLFADLS